MNTLDAQKLPADTRFCLHFQSTKTKTIQKTTGHSRWFNKSISFILDSSVHIKHMMPGITVQVVLSVTFSEVSLLTNSKHKRKKLIKREEKHFSLLLKQTEMEKGQSVSVAMRSCHIRRVMSGSCVMSLITL